MTGGEWCHSKIGRPAPSVKTHDQRGEEQALTLRMRRSSLASDSMTLGDECPAWSSWRLAVLRQTRKGTVSRRERSGELSDGRKAKRVRSTGHSQLGISFSAGERLADDGEGCSRALGRRMNSGVGFGTPIRSAMSMLTTRDHKHSEASAKANSVSAALLVRVALSQALASEAIKSRRQKKLNQLCGRHRFVNGRVSLKRCERSGRSGRTTDGVCVDVV